MEPLDLQDDRPPTEPAAPAKPRYHHYVFAHVALRSVALHDPHQVLPNLASPSAAWFLTALLAEVDEQRPDKNMEADFTVAEMRLSLVRVAGQPSVVLKMPPPRAVTEAHFVAIVLLKQTGEESEPRRVRYFTLEHGVTFDGRPRTVLGEWEAHGGHINYGDGPPAEGKAFVAALERLMQEQG